MSLYVYCPRRSHGALELVTALDASRLRRFDGIDFWSKQRRHVLKDGDVVVCWGASIPDIEGIHVLNALDQPSTAFTEWERLRNVGIPTFYVLRQTRPASQFVPRVQELFRAVDPSYCIQREEFVSEYRMHSFDKRTIRAGIKTPRHGFTVCPEADWRPGACVAHPWIRSFAGGWDVNYDALTLPPDLRRLAHRAVNTLGLTFGAVDIGLQSDGRLMVLEVDRAPRLEGKTLMSYVRAITRWAKGQGDACDAGRVSAGTLEDDGEDGDSDNRV